MTSDRSGPQLHPTLVLASQSPRRRDLLALMHPTFECRPADLDEQMLPGETADALVRRLARAKALAVRKPGELCLGSDTVVVLDDIDPTTGDTTETVLGQPADRDDATSMLSRLSGRSHRVLTGVAVVGPLDPPAEQVRVETVKVTLAELTPARIEWYLATGEADDKAGAYGMQGQGGVFVTSIDGSPSAVTGLPLVLTTEMLLAAGFPLMEVGLDTA